MPHDDLSLSLRPPPPPAEPWLAAPPELQVMTRFVRLPTRSLRQARRVVGLQLDRLSPLPAADTAYDLVMIRQDGAETLYALGIVRKAHLSDAAYANRRHIALTRTVETTEVAFRFRNPHAVDDREIRWLKHAPRAAVITLGLALVTAAADQRADAWREQRMVEIAAGQREAAREALDAELLTSARADWTGLERTDAATRLLCVSQKVSPPSDAPVPLLGYAGEADELVLRLPEGTNTASLLTAGGVKQGGPNVIAFGQEICG
ncbi:hypothetical protein D3C71_308930 [compost metagenome]|jgi:hypothetical protein